MSDSDDDFEFGETLDWVAESLRSVAASEVQIKTELGRNIRQKDNSETFTDLEIKMDSDTVTCDSTPPIPSEPNKVKYPRQVPTYLPTNIHTYLTMPKYLSNLAAMVEVSLSHNVYLGVLIPLLLM